MSPSRDALIVLDEHLMAVRQGLEQRGITVRTVADFNVRSTLDPDVVRAVASALSDPWVLVTMDGTIIDEHPSFEWGRYALAWVLIDTHLRGAAVEHAKANVVQRHAHQMVEQRAGDHFSYTERARFRHPPSLMTRNKR